MRASPMRCAGAALLAGLLLAGPAHAGNQKEEQLADSVRVASYHATSRNSMSGRLKKRLPDVDARTEFLEVAWYEATRAGLDPGLVLGLIQVESAYRKYAVSLVGARGYMQVMPFWTGVIGDNDRRKLFHMQTNLRYGCAILRMYIDQEKGNLYLALGRYNGSRGRPEYPNAVLAAWKNWQMPEG
jgi:soluble lytic murein transglycosylase-like protein